MKITNWEMLRNEWTLERLACNAGKTAISMRSLMSGIFSWNRISISGYNFMRTRKKCVRWFQKQRNSWGNCDNMSHMSMIRKQQQQQLLWLHSQGWVNCCCKWHPKDWVFGLWSLAMCLGPDVGEQSEYLKKIIPARGPRKDLCVVVVTTSQLSGKSDGDGYSNDVIQNLPSMPQLSIWLFERTWVLTSGHQTTDVCDVSHQNGTHLDRNWSNMLSLWASQQSHPTSSAICRNLAKSMTRGYAEAPHKIMAGRKTKAVFPQNDEPIRFVFRNTQVGSKHENTGKNKKGWAKFSKVYKRHQTIKQQDWYMIQLPLDPFFQRFQRASQLIEVDQTCLRMDTIWQRLEVDAGGADLPDVYT